MYFERGVRARAPRGHRRPRVDRRGTAALASERGPGLALRRGHGTFWAGATRQDHGPHALRSQQSLHWAPVPKD